MGRDTTQATYQVIVIGAGYAGVSALHAASTYLRPNEKMLVVDQRPGWGGNWREQYDFVRLHQPYEHFTAFDQDWSLDQPRTYLAKRDEVVDHLRDLGERVRGNQALETLFGHRYVGHRDAEGGQLIATLVSEDGVKREVRTKRLIKATGYNVQEKAPLRFTSNAVQSLTPAELARGPIETNARYFVVGSGKTAMDTVLYLRRTVPNAKVTLIAGRGAMFVNRDRAFPSDRMGRYFGGKTFVELTLDFATRWDGQNHAELMREALREGSLISPLAEPHSCQLGLLSEAERTNVMDTVENVLPGRLVDVQDRASNAVIIMENGAEYIAGSPSKDPIIFIACTDNLDAFEPEPLLRDEGRVLAPQSPLLFTGPSATFLTHAWFLGKLDTLAPRLKRPPTFGNGSSEDKSALLAGASLVLLHNTLLLQDVLPSELFLKDKSNVISWFPVHRRLLMNLAMKRHRKRIQHQAATLLPGHHYPETKSQRASSSKVHIRAIAANGLSFRARCANLGAADTGIILLHGFPQTSAAWEPVLNAVAEQGTPVVAFDQRGYSAGARPGRVDDYRTENLVEDVMAIADAAGFERFHLAGHDWGAAVAWYTALQYPERLLSLAALSVPHPVAFADAVENDPEQQEGSRYFQFFRQRHLPELLFGSFDMAFLRNFLSDLPGHQVEDYCRVLSEDGALTATLNWYRAMDMRPRLLDPNIKTPVLFVRGKDDKELRHAGVVRQRPFMPEDYRELELDADHWLLERCRDRILSELMDHWARSEEDRALYPRATSKSRG